MVSASRRREKWPTRRLTKVAIVPDALYDAYEVADILTFGNRPNTVYEIPDDELVPTWVGPRRGKKAYRGRDIISYIERGRAAPVAEWIGLAK